MALMLLYSSSSTIRAKNPQFILPKSHHSFNKPYLLSIRSQDSTTEPPASSQPADATSSTPANKPKTAGQGFGPPPPKKQPKGKSERATIIRRQPVDKAALAPPKVVEESKEQSENERAFLLTWLVLGSTIIIQGILLASSGFLPEEWDKLLVKYLYPLFTPTVLLFFAGTVVYGVSKYLQNESSRNPE